MLLSGAALRICKYSYDTDGPRTLHLHEIESLSLHPFSGVV